MARFKIDYLKDPAKLNAVSSAEYDSTLEGAVAKGRQRKAHVRKLGAMGFSVSDLNEGGRIVALEVYPKGCPDCDLELTELPPFGDASRYECQTHGIFRVSSSSEVIGYWNAPLEEQQRALKNARLNARKDQEPLVIFYT